MLCYVLNPADPYSLKGWFGTGIDKAILGKVHMYRGEGIYFDPEGLMSTIPAVVQVIFGYLIGDYIQKKSMEAQSIGVSGQPVPNMYPMITGLFIAAVALLVTGYCWNMLFPINKKIWTSSYTIYTTGLAVMAIATMIYFIEIRKVRGWLSSFFNVFGKNALFVFALSAFLPKTLGLIDLGKGVTPWNWLYKKVLIRIPGPPENGSLAYALCVITFMWAICYWMDRRKVYIKV
jgi:predicted acyltransferase